MQRLYILVTQLTTLPCIPPKIRYTSPHGTFGKCPQSAAGPLPPEGRGGPGHRIPTGDVRPGRPRRGRRRGTVRRGAAPLGGALLRAALDAPLPPQLADPDERGEALGAAGRLLRPPGGRFDAEHLRHP